MEAIILACYNRPTMNTIQAPSVGNLLREWRKHRRLSQLDLACDVEVSTRHLSFLETGRAVPSREMLLRLAEQLEIPLRERNVLLVAAGYAPLYPERPLEDSNLQAGQKIVDLVLAGHEPYPALAVDRHWKLIAANKALAPLLQGVSAALLQPPVNVLRLSLHPDGLAPRILNLGQWRLHSLSRLQRQIDITADPVLQALLDELSGYPSPGAGQTAAAFSNRDYAQLAVPLQLQTAEGVLAFISTTTVFGTPIDITLAELAIESFFPADAATAETLRRLSGQAN